MLGLKKSGVPEDMAHQVVQDLILEQKKEHIKENEEKRSFGWLRIGIALVLALISFVVFPGIIILPIGFLVTGVIILFVYRK